MQGGSQSLGGHPDGGTSGTRSVDRRRAIIVGALGATTIWAAPAILTTGVAQAAPSPDPQEPRETEVRTNEVDNDGRGATAANDGPEVLASVQGPPTAPTRSQLALTGIDTVPMVATGISAIAGGVAAIHIARQVEESVSPSPTAAVDGTPGTDS